jgi:hypothetical protein
MAERGIRLRYNLEDFTSAWTAKREERTDSSEDEDPSDEVEMRARDLRRLRPY